MTDQLPPLNRRDVLRLGAAAAVVTGLGIGKADAEGSADVDEADYVIIGSGPGGTPLAANLVAAGFSVVVLEAGPNQGNKTWYEVPAFANYAASEDTQIRWDYFVKHYNEPNANNEASSQWVPGKGVLYPRSSALGGCTTHNALITMAADPQDWSYIQGLTGGDPGWSPDSMWKHWERFLKWQPTEFGLVDVIRLDPLLGTIVASAVHETTHLPGGGDIHHQRSINDKSFVDAGTQGFFYTPQSSLRGKRYTVRERLLAAKAAYPRRLTILTGALAERIVFDPSPGLPKKAIGVEYLVGDHLYGASPRYHVMTPAERDSRRRMVRAKREVIVSAGAFNSPQLLMLSGIGDPALLPAGVDPLINLPAVGTNLQDRYEVSVVSDYPPFLLFQGCTFGQGLIDPCLTVWKAASLLGAAGFTPYNTNGVLGGIKRRYGNGARPEMFIFGTPADFRGYKPGFGPPGFTKDHFTWLVLKAYSENNTGTVRLASNDPTRPPVVNFHSFSEGGAAGDRDVAAVVEGMQMIRRINDRVGIGSELWPGPQVSTPEQLAAWVRKEAWGHHASCTNPIGPVLDRRFKVHGTTNVRVVDASSFPKIPGMFIWAPIATISEKASADILSGA